MERYRWEDRKVLYEGTTTQGREVVGTRVLRWTSSVNKQSLDERQNTNAG